MKEKSRNYWGKMTSMISTVGSDIQLSDRTNTSVGRITNFDTEVPLDNNRVEVV